MYTATLKKLFAVVLGRPEVMEGIPYPKRAHLLPEIPTFGELKCIFDTATTPTHRPCSSPRTGQAYLLNSSVTSLTNVVVTGNTATEGGGGIAVVYGSSTILTDVVITGNESIRGGGMYLEYDSAASLPNGSISSNRADLGGGMFLSGSTVDFVARTTSRPGLLAGGKEDFPRIGYRLPPSRGLWPHLFLHAIVRVAGTMTLAKKTTARYVT